MQWWTPVCFDVFLLLLVYVGIDLLYYIAIWKTLSIHITIDGFVHATWFQDSTISIISAQLKNLMV